MRASGVLETVLYANDLDAAEAFYGGVLGLEKLSRQPTRQVFFRCGEGVLLIFSPIETAKAPKPGDLPVPTHGAEGPGHVCFAASATEIDDWRARLEENGVAIESDFLWPSGGRSIYFRDPAGNSLEFAEPSIWGIS